MNSNLLRLAGAPALWLILAAQSLFAATPPVEQLLPAETFAIVGVRDLDDAMKSYDGSAAGMLVHDPAMKPAMDKFMVKFGEEVIKPLEGQLGVKFSDYKPLARGQFTLAFSPSTDPATLANFLLILDVKDQGEALKTRLGEVRKKWTDAGKKSRLEKIRDIEFTTLVINRKDLEGALAKAFPDDEEDDEDDKGAKKAEKKDSTLEITFGQSGSLLLVASNIKDLEKVVSRQAGAGAAPLAEQPLFQSANAKVLRDATYFGWVNPKPLFDHYFKAGGKPKSGADGMPDLSAANLLPKLGFTSLQMIAFKAVQSPEGLMMDYLAAVPESARSGIWKMLTLQSKDSSPTAVVPADAIRFQRLRLDAPKMWETLETTITAVDPSIGGMLQLLLGTLGKDKDPDFDIKKSLIGNLGDDFVTYAKPPKENSATALGNPPSITLITSPKPDELVNALKVLLSMAPEGTVRGALKEREFVGRKIYSLTLGGGDEKEAGKSLHFAASGSVLALGTEAGILEEYLRSSENPPKPLKDLAGLADAAAKVGGYNTGFFSFQNDAASMRSVFEMIKKNPDSLEEALPGFIPGAPSIAAPLKEWLDVSLLPPYEQVSKYFHFGVTSSGMTPDGIAVKIWYPMPPGLKK